MLRRMSERALSDFGSEHVGQVQVKEYFARSSARRFARLSRGQPR